MQIWVGVRIKPTAAKPASYSGTVSVLVALLHLHFPTHDLGKQGKMAQSIASLHPCGKFRSSWLLNPGCWLLAPGSSLLVPGSWIRDADLATGIIWKANGGHKMSVFIHLWTPQ